MGQGPLDHPRLLAIEQKLDDGELDEAQRLLAELGDVGFFRYATTYLATRLLFQRGRLASAEVAQRLRDLLRNVAYFPQATAMLHAAESGELDRGYDFKHAEGGPSIPSGARRATTPQIEIGPAASIEDDDEERPAHASQVSLPSIPKAAPLPQFTPPPLLGSAIAAQRPIELPTLDLVLDPPPAASPSSEPRLEPRSEPRIAKGAGRYSETPPPPDHVSSRARPKSEPAPPRSAREDVFVRSGPPGGTPESLSLFEIASLLDSGRASDALDALEGASLSDAEAALMRARALSQLGKADAALELLARLRSAPLLDPELRAGVARLLLELGHANEALEQARRAHRDDPEPPIVRLTLAWAAVRALRRGADPRLWALADEMLGKLKSRGGPRPALVLALRACLIADTTDAERAIQLAQRALGIEYTNADALVAMAIASARLGHVHDARQALVRLIDLSRADAAFAAQVLKDHGVAVDNVEHEPRPGMSVTGDDAVWDPLELALLEGRRAYSIGTIEELCRDTLANISSARGLELPTIGTVATSFFTTAPVFRDFAPYDLSLWSISRVDAALAVLYGREPRPKLPSDDYAVLVLVGSYVGEVLRQAHGGAWNGSIAVVDKAFVSSDAGRFQPFRMVKARIREAISIGADDTLRGALAHPGSDTWSHRLACPIAPPCPWDPEPWPDPTQIDVLGRSLSRSIIGSWCERFGGGPLDRSFVSLASLDAYLGLIAPPRVTADANEAWVRRVTVMTGAYLGEVLRSAAGGEWVRGDGDELGPESYRVVLGAKSEVTPLVHALSRITAHGCSFNEFAARLLKR